MWESYSMIWDSYDYEGHHTMNAFWSLAKSFMVRRFSSLLSIETAFLKNNEKKIGALPTT